MAIENIQEVIDYLASNKDSQELTSALEKNGLLVEKQVEVTTQLNDDLVNNYINSNQSYKDKLFNSHRDKTIAKLHNIDVNELTDEHRKAEFVPKNQFEELKGKFTGFKKENVFKEKLGANYELLKPHLNLDSVVETENGFDNVDSQIESLKGKFSNLFETKQSNTNLTPRSTATTQNVNDKDKLETNQIREAMGLNPIE